MKNIMIIDDDVYIGNMLQEALTRHGYGVLRAYSGTEALLLLKTSAPDLILLDLMLPGLSGEEILPRIKDFPVIITSAKADVGGKISLLLEGAADYMTKPFDIGELLARIEVQLRKGSSGGAPLTFGGLSLGNSPNSVRFEETPVKLTRTEYAILKQLMLNPNRVITKSELLELICRDTPDCTESSLKVHISNLRKKLAEAGCGDCIEAVWGIGFKMKS